MMMFQGYDQQTVDFLWGIRFNNDRSWFQEHKEQYQTHLLAPTRALGEQLYDGLHAMLPHEPLILKVSRIYRDARRLHGQGPYKDHLWLCVRTGDQDWTGRPTFYFEIAPDYYSYGMGFWCAAPALMALYRQRIDADPKPLEKLVRRFDRQQTFRLTGPEQGTGVRPPTPVVSEKIPVPAMGSPAGPAYFQPPAAAGDSGELPGAAALLPLLYRSLRRSVPSGGSGRISISTADASSAVLFLRFLPLSAWTSGQGACRSMAYFCPAKPCLPFAH